MNKSFFVMAISAMFFISCSNKETNVIAVDEPQAPEVVALKNDLKALNNELFGEQVVTKARPKWWHYLLTAIADAGVGLLTGNVGYAISASSLTWTVVKDLSVQKIETKSDDETFCSVRDSVFAMSHLDIDGNDNNDGVLHNQVVLNLYERYGEELFKLPEEVLLQAVADEVALLTGCEANEVIPNVAEAKIEMKVYTDAYIESANVDEYIGRLKAVNPEKADALDVLKITLEGFQFVDIKTDDGRYAEKVLDVIDNSDVSPEMKADLSSGVAIANASTRLWNQDELLSER